MHCVTETKNMDSDSDKDSDSSNGCLDDEEMLKVDPMNIALRGAVLAGLYVQKYLYKTKCRNSPHTGWHFVQEMLNGNRRRCHEQFRMVPETFRQLCDLLQRRYNLKHSRKGVRVEEQVGMFLMTCGYNGGNRMAQERFQRSGQTVSHYFHKVLEEVVAMSMDFIKPRRNSGVHPYIRNNTRYWSYFKIS